MATDNPKVSGYVPQVVFDCLQDFKEMRSLKSISLALTVALSEYFQVDQKVDYQTSLLSSDNFVSKERFEALETKFSELSSGLLSELDKLVEQRVSSLRSELLSVSPKSIAIQTVNVESEPSNELLNEPLGSELPSEPESDIPQNINSLQLDLTELEDTQLSEPPSESLQPIYEIEPMNGAALNRRLNLPEGGIAKMKSKHKNNPQKFIEWTKTKDPDGIAWEFMEEKKLYCPIA